MSEILKFKASHLDSIIDQPMNCGLKAWFLNGPAQHLEKTESVTIMVKNEVMGCGGITPYWEGRGQLWGMFNENSKTNFVPVFRLMKHWLNYQVEHKYRRLELSVTPELEIAHRRAKLLGFKLECARAKHYLPSGDDCALYSMVRGG